MQSQPIRLCQLCHTPMSQCRRCNLVYYCKVKTCSKFDCWETHKSMCPSSTSSSSSLFCSPIVLSFQNKVNHFESLPTELLQRILTFLSFKDKFSFIHTCRKFQDAGLMTHVGIEISTKICYDGVVRENEVPFPYNIALQAIAENFPRVANFRLAFANDYSKVDFSPSYLASFFHTCRNLELIDIDFPHNFDQNTSRIFYQYNEEKNILDLLGDLHLKGCRIRNLTLESPSLLTLLLHKWAPSLKYLMLPSFLISNFANEDYHEEMTDLVESMSHLDLISLDLSHWVLKASHITQIFVNMHQLTVLLLENWKSYLTDDSVRFIVQCCPQLKILNLRGNAAITARGILFASKRCPLTYLNISNIPHITHNDIVDISKSSTLKRLVFGDDHQMKFSFYSEQVKAKLVVKCFPVLLQHMAGRDFLQVPRNFFQTGRVLKKHQEWQNNYDSFRRGTIVGDRARQKGEGYISEDWTRF